MQPVKATDQWGYAYLPVASWRKLECLKKTQFQLSRPAERMKSTAAMCSEIRDNPEKGGWALVQRETDGD